MMKKKDTKEETATSIIKLVRAKVKDHPKTGNKEEDIATILNRPVSSPTY